MRLAIVAGCGLRLSVCVHMVLYAVCAGRLTGCAADWADERARARARSCVRACAACAVQDLRRTRGASWYSSVQSLHRAQNGEVVLVRCAAARALRVCLRARGDVHSFHAVCVEKGMRGAGRACVGAWEFGVCPATPPSSEEKDDRALGALLSSPALDVR